MTFTNTRNKGEPSPFSTSAVNNIYVSCLQTLGFYNEFSIKQTKTACMWETRTLRFRTQRRKRIAVV